MKRKIILAWFGILACTLGVTSTIAISKAKGKVIVKTTTEIETESITETYNVDLTQVTSYKEDSNGIVLTFSDGTECLLESAMEKEYVYVICDITDINESFFWALMPNGEIQRFHMIQDPPMDENGAPYFELVVFKVPSDGMDNYDNYETLTVR